MTEENKEPKKTEFIINLPADEFIVVLEREDGYYVQAGSALYGPYKEEWMAHALWADLYYGT